MSRFTQSTPFSIAILLIAMLAIQCGAALARLLFPTIGAPGVTALRIALGCLMLLALFKPWRRQFHRQQMLPLLGYGLALGCMNYLFYLAIATIPLGIAVALEFTGPLAVALLGSRRPRDFLWVTLAVLGLLLLLPVFQQLHNVNLRGSLYALGAGICWAGYILAGRKAGASHGPATVAIGTAVASLVFVPIGLLHTHVELLLDPRVLGLGCLVAFFSTALPYTLEMMVLPRLPARTFGTLMSLEPAVATLVGLLVWHEYLLLTQWVGLACVILASAGVTLNTPPKIKKLN